jgi:hypothetical protein
MRICTKLRRRDQHGSAAEISPLERLTKLLKVTLVCPPHALRLGRYNSKFRHSDSAIVASNNART